MMNNEKVSSLWELSKPGRQAVEIPVSDVPPAQLPEGLVRNEAPALPELSTLDLVRHYTRLSKLNFSIDSHFYPLGSCTMKYNPRINEKTARLEGFTASHPYLPEEELQGSLELMYKLQESLSDIAGFEETSLQPAAGAQGELCGVLMIRKYHESRGDTGRTRFLIPDSAHGTNPASVAMAGYEAVEVPSDSRGNIDLDKLKKLCDSSVAGIMITNPNTMGLFEERILDVLETVHACGALAYGDGANFNAIMGVVRPGELGFDVMHFNLHKTFSTPHGGGGPGAGPVGAAKKLVPFLPGPYAVKNEYESYGLFMPETSIGRMKSFYGNFGVLVRAYSYILSLGRDGLKDATEMAVLNANYLKEKLSDIFPAWYDRPCMHEFVSSGESAPSGINTMDIAKRLIDYGFHPPTVYFPLIVPEALMVEPSETESMEMLDAFSEALHKIATEAKEAPGLLHDAPHKEMVNRLDEVKAVRNPVLLDPWKS